MPTEQPAGLKEIAHFLAFPFIHRPGCASGSDSGRRHGRDRVLQCPHLHHPHVRGVDSVLLYAQTVRQVDRWLEELSSATDAERELFR
uniref:DUF2384 domain-containing protein n=1 Tax=Bursaphelenchus xylophilus TaxID=6326 RepID=A0A1I7RNU7_BURXY